MLSVAYPLWFGCALISGNFYSFVDDFFKALTSSILQAHFQSIMNQPDATINAFF